MKRSYSYAILDVMTTSAQQYDDILYVPVARRIDSIPQSVSDHYPIALEWRLRRQNNRYKSKLNQGGQDDKTQEKSINRPLAEWLFEDDLFATHLATTIEKWNKHRMRGNNRLIEFTELVYKEGQKYLEKSNRSSHSKSQIRNYHCRTGTSRKSQRNH